MKVVIIALILTIGIPLGYAFVSVLISKRKEVIEATKRGLGGLLPSEGGNAGHWLTSPLLFMGWVILMVLLVQGTEVGAWLWDEQAMFWALQAVVVLSVILLYVTSTNAKLRDLAVLTSVALVGGVLIHHGWEYLSEAEARRNAEVLAQEAKKKAAMESVIYDENHRMPVGMFGNFQFRATPERQSVNWCPGRSTVDIRKDYGVRVTITFRVIEGSSRKIVFDNRTNIPLPRGSTCVEEVWAEEETIVRFNVSEPQSQT